MTDQPTLELRKQPQTGHTCCCHGDPLTTGPDIARSFGSIPVMTQREQHQLPLVTVDAIRRVATEPGGWRHFWQFVALMAGVVLLIVLLGVIFPPAA